MREDTGLLAYRIGFWTHDWWSRREIWECLLRGADPSGRKIARKYYSKAILRRLKLIRRPHRPWQGESDNLMWCPRAWTREGALAKAKLWYMIGKDIQLHESRYGQKPWLWEKRWAEIYEEVQ